MSSSPSTTTTTADSTADTDGPRMRPGTLLRAGAITGGAAATANLLILGVARLAGAELLVDAPGSTVPEPVPVVAVLVASVIPLILGAVVYGVLRARIVRTDRLWATTVAIVFALSYLPLLADGLAASTRVTLGLMHVVSAALAVTLLPRTANAGPTR